jgi:hypothetical protein
MTFDRALAQPIRPLLKPGVMALPFALLGLLCARFFPREYYDLIWMPSFVVFAACVVLWTPYLMLVGVCFYAMSQLPFPKSLAFEAWCLHALLLAVVTFLLWRTYTLWPEWAGRKSKKGPAAPWWGYVLGGVAALGLFALMAYFFHFQDP